jgi:organic radical activating enzyme
MGPRSRISRIPAVVGAAAAAAALAGCGGGEPSSSPEDFQAAANRVCRDAEQQLDRVQGTVPKTADQAEEQAAALVDVSQQALDNLRQIHPPDDRKASYERYLRARETGIGFIEQARDAAAHNDAAAYARAKSRLAAGQPVRRQLALQIGLRRCSRPSVPTK